MEAEATPGGVLARARLDHVGVPVASLDAALGFCVALGLELVERRPSRIADGLEIAFVAAPGSPAALELLAPTGAQVPAWAAGPHVAFAVRDLDAALTRCAAAGLTAHAARDRAGRLVAVHLRHGAGPAVELIAAPQPR